MNDQQLGLLIESWLKDFDSPPGDVGRSTAQIESLLPQMRQRSHWWSLSSFERLSAPVAGRSSAGGSSMFSALKFVAAAVIVALFGGFLLAGILTAPQDDEVLPATVADESAFPTGTFESEEDGLTLEFRTDGTCLRAGVPCTYGVNGKRFSEMTFEDPSGAQVPATYFWDYDGESLTFEPWGTDKRPNRQDVYADRVYHSVGETIPLLAADTGFPIGRFVPADGSGEPTVSFRDGAYGSSTGGGNSKYVVNGNLFTEMTFVQEGYEKVPATYYWDFDGNRLMFRLWGEDNFQHRTSLLLGRVYVMDETANVLGDKRRLLLSDPRLDVWVTVEITESDGRYEATATIDEEPLGEGVGDTLPEAVKAALEALGEPYASDMAESISD
jgi:hypothetical protein